MHHHPREASVNAPCAEAISKFLKRKNSKKAEKVGRLLTQIAGLKIRSESKIQPKVFKKHFKDIKRHFKNDYQKVEQKSRDFPKLCHNFLQKGRQSETPAQEEQ